MSDTRTVKSPASAEPLEPRTFLSVSTLVPGFGEGGRVVADLGGQDGAVDLAAEPSGKLIVLANRSTAEGAGYVLARFNADGSPDAAFGDAGRVVSGFADFRIARALALAPDGRILVGGNTADPGIPNADGTTTAGPGSSDFAVARYNADGSLDATFGDGGKALADLNGNSFDDALDLVVADDGRVVAAGVAGPPAGTEVSALASSFAVARFDAGGRLDPTFGAGGRVLTDFAQQENVATSVALQPDGAVVVGGHAGEAGPATDNDAAFAVARYAPDGTPDPAFGDGGKVRVPLPDRPGHLAALAVTGDGKLVAAGTALDPSPRAATPGEPVIGPDLPDSAVALTRLNADGSVDASFGAAGVVVEDFGGSASVDDALLGDDGTLYVAGGLRFNAGDVSLNEVLLARFTAQGAVDATFATNGRVATGFTPENEYDHDRATAVAAGRDGTTVVAGAAAGDTALAAFSGGATPSGRVSLRRGTLSVTGTPGDDTIYVDRDPPSGDPAAPLQGLRVIVNGVTRPDLPADGVRRVAVRGGRGGDSISVAAALTLPTRLDGGPGDDFLAGAYGPDTLTGGPGNDNLSGSADDDRLDGGPGNDTLAGSLGRDVLLGGGGDDRFYNSDRNGEGVYARDLVDGGPGADAAQRDDPDDVLRSIEADNDL